MSYLVLYALPVPKQVLPVAITSTIVRRFRVVSEQKRGTGFLVLAARKMEPKPNSDVFKVDLKGVVPCDRTRIFSSQREFKGREPVMTVTRFLQTQTYFRSSFEIRRSDDRKYDCIPRVLCQKVHLK